MSKNLIKTIWYKKTGKRSRPTAIEAPWSATAMCWMRLSQPNLIETYQYKDLVSESGRSMLA